MGRRIEVSQEEIETLTKAWTAVDFYRNKGPLEEYQKAFLEYQELLRDIKFYYNIPMTASVLRTDFSGFIEIEDIYDA